MRIIFFLIAFLLSDITPFARGALAQGDDVENYVRLLKSPENKLEAFQTAIVRLVPDLRSEHKWDSSVFIDLVSAVHIADIAYYEELNRRFKEYDVLLYELVAEPEHNVKSAAMGDPNNPLSFMQHSLKELLDLEFQLNEIDYSASNFVHADLSPEEFRESMRKHGESFLSVVAEIFLTGYRRQQEKPEDAMAASLKLMLSFASPKRSVLLKRTVAEQLAGMEDMFTSVIEHGGKTLIVSRNMRAIEVLKEKLAEGSRKIGIFYGGAHLAHMEEVLVKEQGLRREHVEWLTAWDLK